jgi:hypothetical protein
MPFDPVTMTLRVTNAGLSIDPPVDVKKPGPDMFRLLAGSIPTPSSPGAPLLPDDPAQPFSCPDSIRDAATGGQKSPLSFDNHQAMTQEWQDAFKAKRSLLLQMEIPGQQGEKLTVKLRCVDETQVSVQSAFAKVAETGVAFVFAIATLLKTVALFFARPFTRRRREEEPEMLPANGRQSLE